MASIVCVEGGAAKKVGVGGTVCSGNATVGKSRLEGVGLLGGSKVSQVGIPVVEGLGTGVGYGIVIEVG
ncbi:MAG: hypothetical protein N2049_07060 [Anaerolineales bacterium]|nr:hypothetical protein [Anaerolineales bacterium]